MFLPKEKFTKVFTLEKRSHTLVDWVGMSIFISAALFAASFVIQQVDSFYIENSFIQAEHQKSADYTIYQRNVKSGKSTPHKTYEEARQALLNNDLQGVLDTIYPGYLWKYEEGLRKASEQGILFEMAERMPPLKEKVYDDEFSTVRYITEPIPGNDNPESIEFQRNSKGVWKISVI